MTVYPLTLVDPGPQLRGNDLDLSHALSRDADPAADRRAVARWLLQVAGSLSCPFYLPAARSTLPPLAPLVLLGRPGVLLSRPDGDPDGRPLWFLGQGSPDEEPPP